MSTGDRLKSLRGKRSLAEMGEELGVTATQLSRIENDKSTPSLELTLKICEYFGVTMDWLIRGIDMPSVNDKEESRSDYVTISKDELIALQRLALDKKDAALEEKDRQLKKLQNDH